MLNIQNCITSSSDSENEEKLISHNLNKTFNDSQTDELSPFNPGIHCIESNDENNLIYVPRENFFRVFCISKNWTINIVSINYQALFSFSKN